MERKKTSKTPTGSKKSAKDKSKRPSDAVFAWRGKYFDDASGKDGAIEIWRVDDVRYDKKLKDWVVMSERVDPPPPKGEAAKEADASYVTRRIMHFRNTFSGRLRKRATKHARAPRVPGLTQHAPVMRFSRVPVSPFNFRIFAIPLRLQCPSS